MKPIRINIVTLFVILSTYINAQEPEKILIAAASDLKFALDSIVKDFSMSNKSNIGITYGSSGKLFEQISGGAPFDIFFSADISYPQLGGWQKSEFCESTRYLHADETPPESRNQKEKLMERFGWI